MSVKEILFDRKLIRLLRIRWTGQLTDGIFQSALASFVLFSPERQADAMSAALAFALVLVPYSIVGPFVGTVLDRFSRQRSLFFANMVCSITFGFILFFLTLCSKCVSLNGPGVPGFQMGRAMETTRMVAAARAHVRGPCFTWGGCHGCRGCPVPATSLQVPVPARGAS